MGLNYQGNHYQSFRQDDVGNTNGNVQHFKCMRWDGINRHPLIQIKQRPQQANHNFCRNPDKDPKGPWCYKQNWSPKYHVESGNPLNSNYFHCDIPVCSNFNAIERCNYDSLPYGTAVSDNHEVIETDDDEIQTSELKISEKNAIVARVDTRVSRWFVYGWNKTSTLR